MNNQTSSDIKFGVSIKLLSVRELAIALGKSENSIRYHIRMGRIKPTLKFGRNMSFDYDQVIKQLKRGVSN